MSTLVIINNGADFVSDLKLVSRQNQPECVSPCLSDDVQLHQCSADHRNSKGPVEEAKGWGVGIKKPETLMGQVQQGLYFDLKYTSVKSGNCILHS